MTDKPRTIQDLICNIQQSLKDFGEGDDGLNGELGGMIEVQDLIDRRIEELEEEREEFVKDKPEYELIGNITLSEMKGIIDELKRLRGKE